MKWAAGALVCVCIAGACDGSAFAVEGPTAAGPIGGTDIRAARLPPPGLYGGFQGFVSKAFDFIGEDDDTLPGFEDAELRKQYVAPFLLYVPDWQILGGSLGIIGYLPMGNQCGRLFPSQSDNCSLGFGDPYLELDWSRSFGRYRASRDPKAYPIFQGLSVLFGFGTTFPVGTYDDDIFLDQVLSISTNIWTFSPSVAVTYTTPPILGEGTEFSAKLFWNNYLENRASNYDTGDLVNIDFAITERWGRLQFGLAGYYAWQPEDDQRFGRIVPPNGWRVESLGLGPLASYDLPAYNATLRIKSFHTVHERNAVDAWYVVFGWFQKF